MKLTSVMWTKTVASGSEIKAVDFR